MGEQEVPQSEQKKMFNFKTNVLQIIVSLVMLAFSLLLGFKISVALFSMAAFTRIHWMFYKAQTKTTWGESFAHCSNLWSFAIGFFAFIFQYLFF
jgi:hypothetical protein